MTSTDAKVLGGIGSLLILLTAVPNVGWVLGIAGFAMTLIAIRKISREYNDKEIWRNMLVAVTLAIGAIATGVITAVGGIFRVLSMGSFVGTKFVLSPGVTSGDWLGLAIVVIGGLLAMWGLLVASGIFVRRSYRSVASKVNVKMFGTAGLLYLIGAATAIVGVGFVLILVAEILLAVSFFSIPEDKVPVTNQALVTVT
jgi:uncharacterized membrane protein